MKILDLLKLTKQQKMSGVWLSGEEGEYKWWWNNGQLAYHAFYKKGVKHGESKTWSREGELVRHKSYKEGKFERNYYNEYIGFTKTNSK